VLTKREKKRKTIDGLKDSFKRQKVVFGVGYKGLKTNQVNELRKKLNQVGANLQIVKKTLIKISFKDFEKEKFQEQMAIIFGHQDEVVTAKTIYEFSKKDDKFKILGGYLGNNFIDNAEIIKLAKLDSRERLLEKLVFVMKNPICRFINTLKANPRKLVFVLNAIKSEKRKA